MTRPEDTAAPTTGNPAYDAVYAYLRDLGDYLPPDPVHRNAIIWRAVQAALNAGNATCDATEIIDLGLIGGPATFGPCILRHNHDGPGHKGANGAQWWPTGHTAAHTANPALEDQ